MSSHSHNAPSIRPLSFVISVLISGCTSKPCTQVRSACDFSAISPSDTLSKCTCDICSADTKLSNHTTYGDNGTFSDTLKDPRARLLPTPDFETFGNSASNDGVDWATFTRLTPEAGYDEAQGSPSDFHRPEFQDLDLDGQPHGDPLQPTEPASVQPQYPAQWNLDIAQTIETSDEAQDLDVYICRDRHCGDMFITTHQLRAHNETRHAKTHHCYAPECHWSFRYAKDLRRHTRSKHSTQKPFVCRDVACEGFLTGFDRKDVFGRYVRRKHREDGVVGAGSFVCLDIACEDFLTGFDSNDALDRHVRSKHQRDEVMAAN